MTHKQNILRAVGYEELYAGSAYGQRRLLGKTIFLLAIFFLTFVTLSSGLSEIKQRLQATLTQAAAVR